MRTRTQIVWMGLLLALFLGFRLVRFSEPPGLDQGLFAYFGQRIPRGDVPYRDIWDSKPPGVFYLYALAFGLFGNRMESIHLFESLYLAATVLAVYGLARHLFGTRAAMFAAGIAIVFQNAPLFGGFWASAQAETFMGLPIVGSVRLMVDRARRERVYALVLSGVLLGLAICLKVTVVLLLPAFLVYLLRCPSRGKRGTVESDRRELTDVQTLSSRPNLPAPFPPREGGARSPLRFGEGPGEGSPNRENSQKLSKDYLTALRSVFFGQCRARNRWVWFLSGLALPLGIVAAYFGSEHALSELWNAVVVYSWGYAREIGRHQHFLRAAIYQGVHFVRMNPTVWVLSTIGVVHLLWRRRSPETLFALSWLVLSFGVVWTQRQFAGYHFVLLVTPIALIAGYGAAVLPDLLSTTAKSSPSKEGNKSRGNGKPELGGPSRKTEPSRPFSGATVRAISIGVFLLLILCLDLRAYVETYRTNLAYTFGRMSRAAYWRTFDRGTVSFSDHRSIGKFLKDHTNDRDHLLVWGLAPAIYVFAERRAATRYVFHHVLLTDAPLSRNFPGLALRRNAFIRRLSDTRPKYIVVGLNDPNGFEPQDSYRQMLDFPAFRRYVFENYRPERRMGNFLLLRRRGIEDVEITGFGFRLPAQAGISDLSCVWLRNDVSFRRLSRVPNTLPEESFDLYPHGGMKRTGQGDGGVNPTQKGGGADSSPR